MKEADFNKRVQAVGPFKLSATHIERLRLLATDFWYTLVPAEGGCDGDSVSRLLSPLAQQPQPGQP